VSLLSHNAFGVRRPTGRHRPPRHAARTTLSRGYAAVIFEYPLGDRHPVYYWGPNFDNHHEELVDLSAYAQLAVRLANAAVCGEEGTRDGKDCDNISSIDGLNTLLTDIEFPNTRATRTDLDAMRGLRTAFREIFAAGAAGNGTEAVDRLNTLLIQHPIHPQIAGHDDQSWHLQLTQGGTVTDRYAAGAAMGLATQVTRLGPDQLGMCQARTCGRVFIDTSASHSRRYCSDRCASRNTATALRTHRRASGTAARPTATV
jgi:predicted RNA-binding Zn ribbon-like protein